MGLSTRAALAAFLAFGIYFVMALTEDAATCAISEAECRDAPVVENIAIDDLAVKVSRLASTFCQGDSSKVIAAHLVRGRQRIIGKDRRDAFYTFTAFGLLWKAEIGGKALTDRFECPICENLNVFGRGETVIFDQQTDDAIFSLDSMLGAEAEIGALTIYHRVRERAVGLPKYASIDGRRREQERGPGNQPASKPVNWQWLLKPPNVSLAVAFAGLGISPAGFILLFGPHRRPNIGAAFYFGG